MVFPSLKSSTISTRILVAVAFLIILIFVLFSAYNDIRQQRVIREDVETSLANVGKTTADGVSNWLAGRLVLMRYFASSVADRKAGSDVSDLFERKALSDTFDLVFYGDKDGGFGKFPKNPPSPADYDPRVRPWYKQVVATGTVALTEPYIAASTQKLVVTAAAPVLRNGALAGVVGADFAITTLQTMLSGINLNGLGESFLVDGTGKILVHAQQDLIGHSLNALFPTDTPSVDQTIQDVATKEGNRLVTFLPIPGLPSVDWHLALSIDLDKAEGGLTAFRQSAVIATLIALALTIVLLRVLISRIIARPLGSITASMNDLAQGNLSVAIPQCDRDDEIGAMGKALDVFKANAIERQEALDRERAEERRLAERADRMEALTRQFDVDIKRILQTVASAINALGGASSSLEKSALQASQQATSVATASEQAAANVKQVAHNTELLSTKATEIGDRVGHSSGIAARAMQQAESTNEKVQGLADAVGQIGEVLQLINGIASQTNLLALNATIEAARAGEAGKGFAVVANEVKNLANQTAQATERVTAQIQSIQKETGDAVTAIQTIAETIGEINAISGDIASAVEEQSRSTDEIGHNIDEASSGTGEVTRRIMVVSQAANQTDGESRNVSKAAQALQNEADFLKQAVERFLDQVRTA
ncbi:methyl-accepting chemotaxis protein [Rhodospirillum sp. A1_3_36]|uniref:methyl-accepting chemotaxis protein n=1 Tax=Rhodospirillum sp. A1_3_36 TaxID=3391666 RepID=UPI0039A73777